jgi:hypothetical protein
MLLSTVQWQRVHRAHSDLDAVTARVYSRCNKRSAYTERPTPPLVEEEAPFLNTYMSRREQKSWSWVSRRPEARNDCAGEGQQQFNRPTDRPTYSGFENLWEGGIYRQQGDLISLLLFFQNMESRLMIIPSFLPSSCVCYILSIFFYLCLPTRYLLSSLHCLSFSNKHLSPARCDTYVHCSTPLYFWLTILRFTPLLFTLEVRVAFGFQTLHRQSRLSICRPAVTHYTVVSAD